MENLITTIEEGNLKIAKFMGAQPNERWNDKPTYSYKIAPSKDACLNWSVDEMQYHKDWGWLMPVIDKIESMGYDTRIHRVTSIVCGEKKTEHLAEIETVRGSELAYIKGNSKIEVVWQCVVEFVESLKERGE